MQNNFSVILPFNNKVTVQELEDSISSISKNTVIPDEMIVVQDGWVRKELLLIIELYDTLLNITIVKITKSKGLSHALNQGVKHVKTDIIIRADADDICLPNRFEAQLNVFKRGADVCGAAIEEIDEDHNLIGYRKCPKSHEEIIKRIKYRNPLNHMTAGFRKHAIESVGGYPNIELREDYALWAIMINAGYIFSNSADVWVKARAGKKMYKRRGGLINVKSEIKLQSFLIKLGVQNYFLAFIVGGIRCLIFILPNKLRGLFYETFLRE